MFVDEESVRREIRIQIERVKQIINACQGAHPLSAKRCIADMMQESVDRANVTMASNDIVKLIEAYSDVKSWEY